jgi:hypothetical protein
VRGAVISVLLAIASQAASQAAAQAVRFITCPVYRDTDAGRKTGCWLADDPKTGTRYDVTPSPTKPDWNRAVLVEGRVAGKQDNACGGVVLDPARVSILDQSCTRHRLEAEGYKGRVFVLPKRNVDPLSEPRTPPPPPYHSRTFSLFFTHQSNFLMYQYTDYMIDQMVTWLRAAKPKRIIITGYAATIPAVVSGQRLVETPAIARERAEIMAETLFRFGFAKDRILIKTALNALPLKAGDADGLSEPSRRRVDVQAEVSAHP